MTESYLKSTKDNEIFLMKHENYSKHREQNHLSSFQISDRFLKVAAVYIIITSNIIVHMNYEKDHGVIIQYFLFVCGNLV